MHANFAAPFCYHRVTFLNDTCQAYNIIHSPSIACSAVVRRISLASCVAPSHFVELIVPNEPGSTRQARCSTMHSAHVFLRRSTNWRATTTRGAIGPKMPTTAAIRLTAPMLLTSALQLPLPVASCIGTNEALTDRRVFDR